MKHVAARQLHVAGVGRHVLAADDAGAVPVEHLLRDGRQRLEQPEAAARLHQVGEALGEGLEGPQQVTQDVQRQAKVVGEDEEETRVAGGARGP